MKKEGIEDDDFMETYKDDSKFGGKSLSSPIKNIEVINKRSFNK